MLKKVKRLLSRILPVPARTTRKFHKETKMLLVSYQEEIKQLNKKLDMIERKLDSHSLSLRKIVNEKDYEYYRNLNPCEYTRALEELFEKRTGKKLDLIDPLTYNEKIQWLKLYDNTPLKTKLSDKYEVRPWIEEKIGSEFLIPLLGVWESYDEINFDELPERFVLKCNHGCAWNLIVRDKKKMDPDAARKSFNKWMNTNYAFINGLELQYKDIHPRIIAEEYIENENNNIDEYKVWCFNGEPEYIQFLNNRDTNLRMVFFDTNWQQQPFVTDYPINNDGIPRPEVLDEILQLAKILSREFYHVRVDFYILNDGRIKFGEMTFTTSSGMQSWDPPEYALILGEKIKLPPANKSKSEY